LTTSSKKRLRLGLRGKLILAILVAGSIPIVIGLSAAYVRGNAELEEVIGGSFQALAEDSASKLDRELERLIAADRILARQAATDPVLRDGLLRSPSGRLDWPASREPDDERWIVRASWVTGAPAGSGAGAKVGIGGLRVGENQYLFGISTPILDARSRALLGWLRRDYDVKQLFDPLTYPIRFGDTGHVMLIDNLGAIVSCPLLATGSRITDADLLSRVAKEAAGWITAQNDGHGGRKFSIIGHAPLPGVNRLLEPGMSWHMFVWQDSGEIFAPARSLLAGVSLAGVLAIGLLGVLGYYASSRIVKPIRTLGQEAAHIASGDLNRTLDIRTRDEIEELADQFNNMRVQLRRLIGNLEGLVQERTRALQDAQVEKDQVVEQLIQSEKRAAIGTMASGIGHEINNPLYAILGMAEAVRDERDIAQCHEHARDIIRHSKEIAEIVKNLSGYVRPGTDGDLELVDVNEKLAEAVTMTRRSILSDHIEFWESLEPIPKILAKPEEIRQVFFNLIRNGVQAIEGKGVLEIRSRRDGGGVSVQIHDTGPGIPEARQGKIFDPFFTTKGPDEGEGLGLYIVQQIVKKYDGTIVLESQPGAGTVFTVRLPVGE
jgi:signal transduction histidine kinase